MRRVPKRISEKSRKTEDFRKLIILYLYENALEMGRILRQKKRLGETWEYV